MKTWITPTKKQVILISGITVLLLLQLMSTTDFLSSEEFSNRQYLIFGVITALAVFVSATAIALCRTRRADNTV